MIKIRLTCDARNCPTKREFVQHDSDGVDMPNTWTTLRYARDYHACSELCEQRIKREQRLIARHPNAIETATELAKKLEGA